VVEAAVGVAAGYVAGVDTAVVVAVKRVVGTCGGSGVTASHVTSIDTAVVVAVKGVVGTRGRVVSETALSETSVRMMVRNIIIIAVTGMFMTVGTHLMLKSLRSAQAPSTTDVLGNTLELVVALLTAGKGTTLGLELLHGHGGQGSSLMVGGLVMVNLMNGNSGVDNVGLDGLLLDNGLDGLVDVLDDVSVYNIKWGAELTWWTCSPPTVGAMLWLWVVSSMRLSSAKRA
jgi:hypothetical protein